MKHLVRISVAILILLVITGLHMTQKTDDKTLTIGIISDNYWGVPSGTPYAMLDDAINTFQAAHPNVKIQYTSGIQKNDYSEWLAEQLLAGTEPDIFLVLHDDFDTYAAMGALLCLDDIIAEDDSFSLDSYYPSTINTGIYNDKHYTLPIECVPTLMFINKTLIAKENIPMPKSNWTWNDFYDICKKVTKDTDGDGVIDQFGCYDYNWKQAALTNGVELFRTDGKGSRFASPQMEYTLQYLRSLKELNRGYQVNAKDFDLGHVAFRPFTFAEYRTYQPYPWRIKKYTSFEWDVVKFPAGPSGHNISPMEVMMVGISSRCKNQKLAWEFLKLVSYDTNIQREVLNQTQGLPVLRSVLNDVESQTLFNKSIGDSSDQMTLASIGEIMETSISETHFNNYDEIMLQADTRIQKIIDGTIPLEGALNSLQRDVNSYLDQ